MLVSIRTMILNKKNNILNRKRRFRCVDRKCLICFQEKKGVLMKTLLVMTQNGLFNNSVYVFYQTIQFEQQVYRKDDKQTLILETWISHT